MKSQKSPQNSLDLAIIGSGPAALTAALYAARFGLRVTVFEKDAYGGALNLISDLRNFPGFRGEGSELATTMKQQAEEVGVEFQYGTCESLSPLIIDGEEVSARAILIATGSENKHLDFEPDIPVSYCAICDAPLYRGKNLLVIGGGNSAVGESIYLAKIAKHVTIATHSKLKADEIFMEMLRKYDNVDILEHTEITKDTFAGYDAAFVFIGKCPATSFVNLEILDDAGYIVTNNKNQTAVEHIFAAGDVRQGTTHQAITASGDGAAAAIAIHEYLKNH